MTPHDHSQRKADGALEATLGASRPEATSKLGQPALAEWQGVTAEVVWRPLLRPGLWLELR